MLWEIPSKNKVPFQKINFLTLHSRSLRILLGRGFSLARNCKEQLKAKMKLLEGWGLKSQEGKEIIKLIKLFSEKKRIQPQKTKITQISRYVFFFSLQLPADQFIGWHIWNNEKQIQRMTELSKEFVSMIHMKIL